jgi:hypothetical protein
MLLSIAARMGFPRFQYEAARYYKATTTEWRVPRLDRLTQNDAG